MTPHQALALAIRLFAVWFALVTAREALGFLGSWRPQDDPQSVAFVVVGYIVVSVILLVLWFFPRLIAQGLLPASSSAPVQPSSYQTWFRLGIALLGLWFIASSVAPILRNLTVMYLFGSELPVPSELRALRMGLLYYSLELVVGLCLLIGAARIEMIINWTRNVGAD